MTYQDIKALEEMLAIITDPFLRQMAHQKLDTLILEVL